MSTPLSSNLPLVSCIMPTRGRPSFAAESIEEFLSQTWLNKELIIVDDVDYRSCKSTPRFPGVYYSLIERRTVGEKRNHAIVLSRGSVICHWDDDDWSSANRVTDQVERLIMSGKSVTGYNRMKFTDGHNWYEYSGVEDYALGTSLMYTREFWNRHKFRPVPLGEDNHFVNDARFRGELISVDAGEMMYATIHGNNTSQRDLGSHNYRRIR